MIKFANPKDFQYSTARAMTADVGDWIYLSEIMAKAPKRFHAGIANRYSYRRAEQGQQAANIWIREFAQTVTVTGAGMAASDAEICNRAKDCAVTVRGMLADSVDSLVGIPVGVMVLKLADYCASEGVAYPVGVELQGAIARLTDAGWWRRQFRRTAGRQVESFARSLGFVHRRAGLYASDETVARREEQQRRNLAGLENTEAFKVVTDENGNESEEVFNLAELAALGMANPAVRFAELMVRVRGMEEYAKKHAHVGIFITGTAPGSMHAYHGKTSKQNKLFDQTTPREAQQWIARQWSRCRAALARLDVKYYGVRVAEPHHDGTPHWHMLVFVDPMLSAGRSAIGRLMAVFRRYMLRGDWVPSVTKKQVAENIRASGQKWRDCHAWAGRIVSAEYVEQRRRERADGPRRLRACDFKLIDWSQGSAAGYLVKYLAKNISGQRMGVDDEAGTEKPKQGTETAGRVLAWASCWGIRQFQVVGGPPVGVWRELRRVKEQPEQLELFAAWSATGSKEEERKPDWCGYVEAQGGIDIKRGDRPVQLWKLAEPGRRTKYMDIAPARVAGVECAGQTTATRDAVWQVRRAGVEKRLEKPRSMDRRGLSVGGTQGWGVVGLGLGLPLGPQAPRTRVNNCTARTKSPESGLARNMAGWSKEGRPDLVLTIFEELRRFKGARSDRRSSKGVGEGAGSCESLRVGLYVADAGGVACHWPRG